MVNESIGSPLQRYAAVNDLLLKRSGEETMDVSFQATLEFMMETNWTAPANGGGGSNDGQRYSNLKAKLVGWAPPY